MRWLKHMTRTRDDERVARLIGQLGHEGYGLWWMVLETVAASIDGGSEKCSLRYPVSKWAAELQLHPPNVSRKLAGIAATGLLEVSCIGAEIEVRIPKLLKYRDEYSKKSRHSQDIVRRKDTDTDTDTETETEHTPKPPARAPATPATIQERKRDPEALWQAAGFSGPEDFSGWWDALVARHPNRTRNSVARALVWERILAGNFRRDDFESGYSQLAEANAETWTEERGRFCPNLHTIIYDGLWKYTPPEPREKLPC